MSETIESKLAVWIQILAALVSLAIGGISFWVMKLDDRVFDMAQKSAASEERVTNAIRRLDDVIVELREWRTNDKQ